MVAVFPVKTEPKPGVSTKHMPEDNKRAGHEYFRAVHAFFVFGVQLFGHVFLQVGHGNVPPGAVPHANPRVKFVAEPNHGRHRRDRNKPGRNNFVADQSVEQGGFASLELADTGYIETSFGNPRCEVTRFFGDRLSPKFLSQVGKPQQTGGAVQRHGCLSRRAVIILHRRAAHEFLHPE